MQFDIFWLKGKFQDEGLGKLRFLPFLLIDEHVIGLLKLRNCRKIDK